MARNLQIGLQPMSLIRFVLTGCMLTGFVFITGCKRAESIEQESLFGRWEIQKAERNGKETTYLRNGYFIMNPDGSMTVNITGEDEKGTFTLDKNKILMSGNKVFEIQAQRGDSLNVRYVSESNSEFIFHMLKKKEDAQ
jgi:hypothetical protein